jgi:hypothetical protein
MSTFILLTSAQADAVRGVSPITPEAALMPIALTDGRYILNVSVLSDPAHADDYAFLSTLPTADLADLQSQGLIVSGGVP